MLNQVTFGGYLGGDPEVRHTNTGKTVAEFSICSTRRFKTDTGDQEESTWINVVCWAKTAELAAKYLNKGKPVIIIGRIQEQKWETDSGDKRRAHKIVADRIVFLPKGTENAAQASSSAATKTDDEDDDLPF